MHLILFSKWCKPPRKVLYKCTFGIPDQGQMLDVWESQTSESALRWRTCHIAPRHILELTLEVILEVFLKHVLGIKTMTSLTSERQILDLAKLFLSADQINLYFIQIVVNIRQFCGIEKKKNLFLINVWTKLYPKSFSIFIWWAQLVVLCNYFYKTSRSGLRLFGT